MILKLLKYCFVLAVAINNMQSRMENARITVKMKDSAARMLPLTNPGNIDDWLSYQQSKLYAESGYIQMSDTMVYLNILAVDFGMVKADFTKGREL